MPKHTILFLAANPSGTDPRALDREARSIQAELKRSGHRDCFDFVTRWAVEPLDLLRELRELKPTVVHFSGHSGQNGLSFQAADGHPQVISPVAIAETFQAAGNSVKLVVLNTCYSEPCADMLLAHVDCVVGMGSSLHDEAARSFAIGFYGALGERESFTAAWRQGNAAISLAGLPDTERPQLKVRNGSDATQLCLITVSPLGSVETDPAARSGHTSPQVTPTPSYSSAAIRVLSEQLEDARDRRQKLHDARLATNDLDLEILDLRRQLREGGQLRAGDSLGNSRYLLVKPVGRGGFAVVWEAYDRVHEQRVAIKVLHSNLAGDHLRRDRFFRGARAMMRLTHPAVVRVLNPEEEGFCYFVMEFVPNGDLRRTVLEGRLKKENILPLMFRVIEAVTESHKNGMVHRDIKPSNILLDEEGNPKLTDFDLVGAADTTGGTRTGALGTLLYAAPECLDRPQEATTRADVYGLGMTAIFCISGRELSMSTFRHPERTISGLSCSSLLKALLLRAVAWEPSRRFADAEDLGIALRDTISPRPLVDITLNSLLANLDSRPPMKSRTFISHESDEATPDRSRERPTQTWSTTAEAKSDVSVMRNADAIDELRDKHHFGRWWLAVMIAVSIIAGTTSVLIISLTREDAPVAGSLHVDSFPSGADVYLQGNRFAGKTPLTINNIPIGTRDDVRVELARHQHYTETINIPPTGGSVSVTALLKPITGKIIVYSQPGGAEIRINDRLRGHTPTTVLDVDMATAKQLELRLKGYQPLVVNLDWPTDGQISLDHLKLISDGMEPKSSVLE